MLGPGSDWYHEDHIHLDLAQRRNDYRICQWNVWDPLPQIAPLLPAERPEEAPPREVAAKPEGKSEGKSEAKSEGAKDEADDQESAKPAAPVDKPAAHAGKSKPTTKKRR